MKEGGRRREAEVKMSERLEGKEEGEISSERSPAGAFCPFSTSSCPISASLPAVQTPLKPNKA